MGKDALFTPITKLVVLLDQIDCVEELFGVFPQLREKRDRGQFKRLPLKGQNYKLLHDSSVAYCGRRAHLKLAPIKEIGSAVRKALAYYDEFHEFDNGQQYTGPACGYITDLIRLTISAADPYVIYVLFEVLKLVPWFEVLQVKNKYAPENFDDSGSPSILLKVKVWLPDEDASTICEVQLYVDSFLSLKKITHKTYEINRADAGNVASFMKPLFDHSAKVMTSNSKAETIADARRYFDERFESEQLASVQVQRPDLCVELGEIELK